MTPRLMTRGERETQHFSQIQGSKREKSDLHVVCVDSSVPHKVVKFALEFFNIPACIITIIVKSFSNLHMSFPMDGFSAGWQSWKLALQWAVHITNPVCVIGAREMAGGLKTSSARDPTLRGYMYDVTIILQTAPCTSCLLSCLNDLTTKSQSPPIRKCLRDDRMVFTAGGEKILLLAE